VICVSTRGQAPPVSFRDAVLAGLAPDGGLYVPQTLNPLPKEWWAALRGKPFQQVAVAMATALVGDEFRPGAIEALIADALDFPMPIVPVAEGLSVLELFHGPTFAFKDVGARVLARLLSELHGKSDPLTVLVATSGDTGSAVAHAFFGLAGTRVVVLYPDGHVSAVQEAQFATLGGNVTALAVQGTFDDCQRMVKEAFADRALTARARLTSANSISLGRLLPQVFYYAYAALQRTSSEPLIVSVPSGNFGNLAAGVMAWRLGAPIAGFVAATTVNDTVPRYLLTGRLEPRPSVPTLANAMDVGNPSNLERLRWLFTDDLHAMQAMVSASVHTDDDVRGAIRELDDRYGYVADPHTAIGYLGSVRASLFLATAHPAKFREVVEPAIGRTIALPAALEAALGRPRNSQRISPTAQSLVKLL
jgi:threonine synthase